MLEWFLIEARFFSCQHFLKTLSPSETFVTLETPNEKHAVVSRCQEMHRVWLTVSQKRKRKKKKIQRDPRIRVNGNSDESCNPPENRNVHFLRCGKSSDLLWHGTSMHMRGPGVSRADTPRWLRFFRPFSAADSPSTFEFHAIVALGGYRLRRREPREITVPSVR